MRLSERSIRALLERGGVTIGGTKPWDIRVKDAAFYTRVARDPAFEVGETYMDGMWECDAVDELFYKLLRAQLAQQHERGWRFFTRSLLARVFNRQSRKRARIVAEAHYDLDTELYETMLDPTMTYTCAFWDGASSLEQA